MSMNRFNCHDRFDDYALQRWEGEGGCMGRARQQRRIDMRSPRRHLQPRDNAKDAAPAVTTDRGKGRTSAWAANYAINSCTTRPWGTNWCGRLSES